MTTDALEPYQAPATPALRAGNLDYPTMLELGKAFAASGLFPGVKDQGVAVVKILAGAEWGLEPVAAMNGIDIIATERRPPRMRPNADVQALLAARAGYTFEPVEHDDTHCVLQWFRNGDKIGRSEFSVLKAKRANLVREGGAWNAWGENMCLARAITQGVKLFCRHVLAGSIGGMQVVTSEELDDEYPDPRDDLVKALHATYRERFPKPEWEDAVLYRARRLVWSEEQLGRPVPTWNGPEAPETLTRADVQILLDALQAPDSGPPAGPPFPERPGPAIISAGDTTDTLAPAGPATDTAPAEHHSDEVPGEEDSSAEEAAGRVAEAGVTAQPVPAPAALSRRSRKPGKPNLKEAALQATAERRQTTTEHEPTDALHFIGSPTFRQLYVAWFEDQAGGDWSEGMEDARRHAQAHLERLRSEGQMGDQFTRPQLEQMAAETFERKP